MSSDTHRNFNAGMERAEASFSLLEGRIARAHEELTKAGVGRDTQEAYRFPASLQYRIKQLAAERDELRKAGVELQQRLRDRGGYGLLPLEERLENQSKSIKQLYEQRDELEARTVELHGKLADALGQVTELRRAGEDLQQRLRDRSRGGYSIEEVQRIAAEANAAHERARGQLAESRDRENLTAQRLAIAQAKAVERLAEVAKLRRERDEAREKADRHRARIVDLLDQLATLRGNHERQRQTIAEFQRTTGRPSANAPRDRAPAASRWAAPDLSEVGLTDLLREVARRCD